MTLQVEGFAVGPLAENCWLVTDTLTKSAVLVDPGDEPDRLLAAVDQSGCVLEAIWLTHAHFDHLGAVAAIVRDRPVPVFLHPLDGTLYTHAAAAANKWAIAIEQPVSVTSDVEEGATMTCGSTTFAVWHLPGHAPGHVAFIGGGYCISGDVLFAGSIGRTDLPLCDPSAMQRSLERLTTLPPDTRVLPGHGEATSIARESRSNPFLRGLARPVGA